MTAKKTPSPKRVVSKAKEVVLDVVQGALTGAAAGALGGAATAVGTYVGGADTATAASPDQDEQKENDSPQTGESSSSAAA
jgi:hypothetical protein